MLQDIEDERDYKRLIRMKELEVELKERINALKVERSVFRKQLKCLDVKLLAHFLEKVQRFKIFLFYL